MNASKIKNKSKIVIVIISFMILILITPQHVVATDCYDVNSNLNTIVAVKAGDINNFIKNKGTVWVNGVPHNSADSPLVGLGQYWVDAGNKYGINSVDLMAHAVHESGWGFSNIAQTKHNIYGYGAYDPDPGGGAYTFSSYQECIDKCAGWIKDHYLTIGGNHYNGATLAGMNVDYATDPNWGNGIASIMSEFADTTLPDCPPVCPPGQWCEEGECVPEASTLILFAIGLLFLTGYVRLKRRKAK